MASMTRMFVRVTDAQEAAQAQAAGIDGIELSMPATTDEDLRRARAVRLAFHGALRLRFEGLSLTPEIVTAATDIQAEEVALPLDTAHAPLAVVDTRLPPGLTCIAVLSAATDPLEALQRVRDRVGAVMLDTQTRTSGGTTRLFDKVGIGHLDTFASACRAIRLPFGLAGALESPDVARLLLLEPDTLEFDTGVRVGHCADKPLDPAALDAIRALIPRPGAPVPVAALPTVTDRIFVRDFVAPLSIGAYQAEHGTRQRVRFSVEADVARDPVPPRDMRDVFSYDVIIETIRVLSQRAHVTFVETLAEEIAAALLAHAAIACVIVKVEKLDVIDGAVGIEITRRRPTP